MSVRKFIVRQILERWVANRSKDNIQGIMNKANILLWEEGRCQLGLVLEEKHTNIEGTLHNSMAILLADVTSALALFSHPQVLKEITYPQNALTVPSTVNLNFSFLDTSAWSGDKILVDASVRKIILDDVQRLENTNVTNSPLASLYVSIVNTKTNILLVKGDMLMHIEALATEES